MATKVFFFAEADLLEAQTSSDDAFGPIANNNPELNFRVTSIHRGIFPQQSSIRATPAAFAVCNGRLRVQLDNFNPNLLSIVLAPDENILPGVPIRYFVYHGIRKDSLMTGNSLLQTPLTSHLGNSNTNPFFVPDSLGLAFRPLSANPPSIDFARENTDPIQSLFFETSTVKPIIVKAGENIGLFDGEAFGIDIILETQWEDAPLSIVRNFETSSAPNNGTVLSISTNDTPARQRAMRERVYGYLDPVAFYGACFASGVRINVIPIAIPLIGAPSIRVTSPNLLHSLLELKFFNRGKVYVDIRNHNGLSYNYYDCYGDGHIRIGLDSSMLESRSESNTPLTNLRDYYTYSWPLLMLDRSDFTVISGEEKAGIRLSLFIGAIEGPGRERKIYHVHSNQFYNLKGRKKPGPPVPSARDAGVVNVIQSGDWTREIVLATSVANIQGTPITCSSYHKLQYYRQWDGSPIVPTRFVNTGGSWDNLFAIKPNPSRWKSNSQCDWWTTGHFQYVRESIGDGQVYEGVAEAGIAIDRELGTLIPKRITFFSMPISTTRRPETYYPRAGINRSGTSTSMGAAATFFQLKESGDQMDGSGSLKLAKVSEYKPLSLTQVLPPLTQYQYFLTYVENSEDTRRLARPNLNRSHAEALRAISISELEFGQIALLISQSNLDVELHPIFLQVVDQEVVQFEDLYQRGYMAMQLALVGYDSSGQFQYLQVPSTGVNAVNPVSLFTEGHLFCTRDAAAFEPLPIDWAYQEIVEFKPETYVFVQQNSEDLAMLRSGLASIKRCHPVFYGKLENMRMQGVEVILHDAPGTIVRQKYTIQVSFDLGNSSATGMTLANNFYNGILPGLNTSVDSNSSLGLITGILDGRLAPWNGFFASPWARYSYVDNQGAAFPSVNISRYVDLNRNTGLKSSEVNERFLFDYSQSEIDQNLFDPNKIFLATYWLNPLGQVPQRISLAGLRNLGYGTLDWNAPVTIQIDRAEILGYANDLGFTYTDIQNAQRNGIIEGYSPRLQVFTQVLIHELGHAESYIKDRLVSLIWGELDSFFSGTVSGDIAKVRRDGLDFIYLENLLLVTLAAPGNTQFPNAAPYPNPAQFSTQLFWTNNLQLPPNGQIDANAQLAIEGFMAKRGDGHLRGSPNALNACGLEYQYKIPTQSEILRKIGSVQDLYDNVNFPSGVFLSSLDYCFLNYDDATIQ